MIRHRHGDKGMHDHSKIAYGYHEAVADEEFGEVISPEEDTVSWTRMEGDRTNQVFLISEHAGLPLIIVTSFMKVIEFVSTHGQATITRRSDGKWTAGKLGITLFTLNEELLPLT